MNLTLPSLPRILISGLSGGAGKTTVSLGLARYFATLPRDSAPTTSSASKRTANDSAPHSPSFIPRPFELPWEQVRSLMYSPRSVQTFKKGPDYIDAAWLGLAAGCITKTLDPYFSTPQELVRNFTFNCQNAGLAIIEGNRGIHDGLDAFGSCSSATLAKILGAPVLLVVDCTKMTRTVAALVLGCIQLDPEVTIGGVILNKLGTSRQETLIRQAIEHYTDVPVLGALPRQRKPLLVERKLGLSSITDTSSAELDTIARLITEHIDTEAIGRLASTTQGHASKSIDSALSSTPLNTCSSLHDTPAPKKSSPSLHTPTPPVEYLVPHDSASLADTSHCAPNTIALAPSSCAANTQRVRPTIGYIYDEALWFYYPENLEALHQAGANLLRLSLFDSLGWDRIDGLYSGGGHLDTHIQPLSQSPQLKKLFALSHGGMPIYLEGSSLALACRELVINKVTYPMAAIFDASMTLTPRPHGLGYTKAHVSSSTPFFDEGATISGHQFNYFRFESARQLPSYLTLSKGRGLFQTPPANPQRPPSQAEQIHLKGLPCTNSSSSANKERFFHQHDGLVYQNTCASLSYLFAPSTPQWAPRFVQLCHEYLA